MTDQNKNKTLEITPFIIKELEGKVFTSVKYHRDIEEIHFKNDIEEIVMIHHQDCCESVYVESIEGDLSDLENSTIRVAEERVYSPENTEDYESVTFTFYTFRTIKGTVVIRWVGTSNGYYSESVSIENTSNDE